MERSGVVDIQSHALTHTWYFSGPVLIDFHRPGNNRYPWLAWNLRPDQKPFYMENDQSGLVPWGAPIYEYEKALICKRYFPPEEVAEEMTRAGRHPYIVPVGGSNPVGAAGYVAAMEELMEQLAEQDLNANRVVFPSGSGGTQAGLIIGAKALGFAGQIVGISVSKAKESLKPRLEELAAETAAFLGLDLSFASEDFIIHDDYLGEGYARMGPPEREAIRLSARTEGLLLDPVYTGRAMAGLIDLIGKGVFRPDETILFWHTGGTPALFAYADELLC